MTGWVISHGCLGRSALSSTKRVVSRATFPQTASRAMKMATGHLRPNLPFSEFHYTLYLFARKRASEQRGKQIVRYSRVRGHPDNERWAHGPALPGLVRSSYSLVVAYIGSIA